MNFKSAFIWKKQTTTLGWALKFGTFKTVNIVIYFPPLSIMETKFSIYVSSFAELHEDFKERGLQEAVTGGDRLVQAPLTVRHQQQFMSRQTPCSTC